MLVEPGCARALCGGGITTSASCEAYGARCQGGFVGGVRMVIDISET
jgi:hypothetical protein